MFFCFRFCFCFSIYLGKNFNHRSVLNFAIVVLVVIGAVKMCDGKNAHEFDARENC